MGLKMQLMNLEELFLHVIAKEYGDSSNYSCIVNLDKGEIEIYSEKIIVDEVDDYKVEITLDEEDLITSELYRLWKWHHLSNLFLQHP